MYRKNLKYLYYSLLFLSIYIISVILIRLINLYSIVFIIILLIFLYFINKKLFKKILYKIIYNDKKTRITFKDKYGTAKLSLERIAEINNKINDKVKYQILNYEK